MEELKSNAELRAEASDWVATVLTRLDLDDSGLLVILSPFFEPWLTALVLSEMTGRKVRFREIAPYQAARMRCVQATHYSNLLDFPNPRFDIIRVRPENLFDPPSRAEMLETLERHIGADGSVGDVAKVESGWIVVLNNADEIQGQIRGYTVKYLRDDERDNIPPATMTGERTVSVASPRIDAVAAAVLKPSREKIKKHLESGGVLLNYIRESKAGRELSVGDIVAVRGAGRFRVVEIEGYSKKGKVRMRVDVINGP